MCSFQSNCLQLFPARICHFFGVNDFVIFKLLKDINFSIFLSDDGIGARMSDEKFLNASDSIFWTFRSIFISFIIALDLNLVEIVSVNEIEMII